MKISILKTIKDQIEKKGYYEIINNVIFYSKERILKEQKKWDLDDTGKRWDFSVNPYWIITTSSNPHGFNTIEEAFESLDL